MTFLSNETVDQMVANVRRLAEENPDKVAECLYEYCIVGRAAHQCDLLTDMWEGDTVDEMIVTDVFPNTGASRWLAVVQAHQDAGFTWGVAVEIADKSVPSP